VWLRPEYSTDNLVFTSGDLQREIKTLSTDDHRAEIESVDLLRGKDDLRGLKLHVET